MAYRGLRDVQLGRGLLEGEVAGGGFEYAQRIQRWQAVNHAMDEFFLCEK